MLPAKFSKSLISSTLELPIFTTPTTHITTRILPTQTVVQTGKLNIPEQLILKCSLPKLAVFVHVSISITQSTEIVLAFSVITFSVLTSFLTMVIMFPPIYYRMG